MNVAIRIERRGRKRKAGARHPGGQLVRERSLDPKVVAAAMPHRSGVPKHLAHDPKAETVLGRYNLNGLISNVEYDAGAFYRGVVGRYLMLINAPFINIRSMSAEPRSAGQSQVMDDNDARRVKQAYDDCYVAVSEGGGQRGAKAIAKVAIYDQPCPHELFGFMRMALCGLLETRGMCNSGQLVDLRTQIRQRYGYIR